MLGRVRVHRKPTWGTCAGLILLAESANRTKKGGQDLIGGLDVRVHRNYFGRQTESFEADIDLPFLTEKDNYQNAPFHGVFIRAPVVEKILPRVAGEQAGEARLQDTVIAPARKEAQENVEVVARLSGRTRTLRQKLTALSLEDDVGDIIAVKQQNVFGTSFHPELTDDARIHSWWLEQVIRAVGFR